MHVYIINLPNSIHENNKVLMIWKSRALWQCNTCTINCKILMFLLCYLLYSASCIFDTSWMLIVNTCWCIHSAKILQFMLQAIRSINCKSVMFKEDWPVLRRLLNKGVFKANEYTFRQNNFSFQFTYLLNNWLLSTERICSLQSKFFLLTVANSLTWEANAILIKAYYADSCLPYMEV